MPRENGRVSERTGLAKPVNLTDSTEYSSVPRHETNVVKRILIVEIDGFKKRTTVGQQEGGSLVLGVASTDSGVFLPRLNL